MKKVSALSAALVAVAMAPAPAVAAVLIGAKTITISRLDPNSYLQVGEVIATNSLGTNVALASNGAVASAPDSYQVANPLISAPVVKTTAEAAAFAIDGVNVAGYPNIYHSATAALTFLTVTLAAPSDLTSLTIYGRITDANDYMQSRDRYAVSIFDNVGTLIWSGNVNAYANAQSHGSNNVGDPNFDFATADLTTLAPAAVPEPASWAMMFAGFAAVGASLRRRKQNVRVTFA